MAELDASKLSTEIAAAYSLTDNTLIRQTSAGLRVEVGDAKVADAFLPQVKFARWNNEANLSVRLRDFDTINAAVATSGRVISWQDRGGDRARFYERAADADHPDGAYEFEVVFTNKPTSNVVAFTIQTKGLRFLYQGSLTDQEIADGCERPENVVGSYAVYHENKTGNRYETGKLGHIYRPKAVDRNGAWTWCDLTLNVAAGTLTVTVPQVWLDTAVYPVMVDPTFGYSTSGASTDFGTSFSRWYGSLFTSPSDVATGDSIHAYCKKNGGTPTFKGVLVTHADLVIVANGVGNGVAVAETEMTDKTSAFSTSPDLVGSTAYVIGLVVGDLAGESIALAYDGGDANQGHSESDNNYATPTNPTSITHSDRKYSVWVVYTAASTSVTGTGTFAAASVDLTDHAALAFRSTATQDARAGQIAATASEAFQGTAETTVQPATLTLVGTLRSLATGTLTAAPGLLTGDGSQTFTGTASLATPSAKLDGTGTFGTVFSGTASVQVTSASLTGQGTEAFNATGNVQVENGDLTATGTESFAATGQMEISSVDLNVESAQIITGTGSVQPPAADIDVIAVQTIAATAQFVAAMAALSAKGNLSLTGTGSYLTSAVLLGAVGTMTAVSIAGMVSVSDALAASLSVSDAGNGSVKCDSALAASVAISAVLAVSVSVSELLAASVFVSDSAG